MAANDIKRLKQELEAIKKAKQQIQQTELAESIAAQAQRQEEAIEENASTKNGGGNFGKGLLYLGEELGLGLVRGIEGAADFVVGGVADLAGGDAFAERMMKNDWLNYSHADEWFDPGKGWEFAGDVASGVGGMLPSVAITLATGGAAAPVALAGSIGSTALFGLGAAGQATSETVKETGELGGKEWLYGAGSGALETGIELISGGIGGSKVGKVFGKNLAKSTAGKIASTVIGEGVEEVASDVANPLLRRVTGVDKSLAEAYKDVDAESLLRTFAVGGLTGAVMGGGSTAIGAIKSKGYNNYAAAQTAEQLSEWKADANKSQAEGKKSIYKQKDIAKVAENLSKRLQNMDDTSRSAFLERNANIAYMFNADGTVTENAVVEAKKGKKERAQLNPEGTTENIAPTTATDSGSYNPDAYSAGLKGYEGKLEYKPVSSSSKVSSEVKGVMNTLAKISRGKANIVLTDADLSAEGGIAEHGLYKEGIIYLNANATDYQKALAVGVHEVVHTLEGTKDYDNLARHIADVISKDPALQEKYNQEKYRKAYDALLSGDYTETTKNYQASTEIFATYIANELAGNEASVKRLINKDRNIVVRILDWVKNAIAKLGMSKEERAMRKDLEKLENLLSNALKSGTGGRPLEDVEKTARAAEKAHLEDELKKKKAAQAEETEGAVDNQARGVQALTEEQAIKRGVIDKKGGTVRYNVFTFEEGGGKQLLEKNLKKNGFTQAEINETVKTMTDMAEYFRMLEADVEGLVDWNSAKVLYDPKTGKNVFTAMIKNGDYPLNIDLSTICKKRKALTKVLNTLVKRGYIDTVDLSSENIVKINEILKKYKYEVACPACFVETKRYRVDDWANKFLDPWNELIKNSVQNAQNLDFANGVYAVKGTQIDTEYLNRVIKEHTKVSEKGKRSKDSVAKMATLILENESVRGYLNKADMIGSIGLEKMKQHQDKLYSLVLQRSGTATPKIIQEVQPYNSELSFQNQLAKKAEEVGGVRMFSFSDFTVLQTFDFLQVVADLASKRATMQSYTKEITFALLFGQTGIKINLSMIPAIDKTVGKNNAGLDSKGNPIYSKQWGVDYDTAKSLMFKDGYNGNVGTATIGISKNHILKLLDDPVTNYIIPYHKSSINPTLAKMMDIDWYTDYTSVQNTRYSNGEKITATEAKKFNFFKELAAAKDARKMAQNYLEWCKKNNYTPKFDEFAWHPNYYKLLVDFQVYKTVDGKEVYAPQNPVQMKLPDNFKEILKSELKNQEELDASRDVNFEKAMGEVVAELKKPTARAYLDVELAKKTSDRVQTIVKDKGVVRQTISDIREGKKSVKETWDDIMEELKYGERARWIEVQIALTDQQAGIAKAAKNLDINVNGEIQRARAAKAAALNMLIYKQTDFAGNVIGESLREIFDPIQKKGAQYSQNFNEYLLHQLNIDRMSLEVDAKNKIKQLFKNNPQLRDAVNERYDSEEQWREVVKRTKGGKEYLSLLETENKPVFQEEVTAEFSKERIAELDKQHPTFKDAAEKVWKYNKNLLQYRVDAGLITQAQADQMNKMYPHYVPAFYDTMNVAKTGASVAKNRVAVRTGIKSAKGSSGKADIIDVSLAISRQTESVVRAAAINNLVTKLYDKAVETSTFIDLDVAGQEKLTDPNVDYDEKIAKDNQVVFYKDGEKITLDVSEYMYAGFEGLGLYKRELNNPLESVTTKGVEIFKKLVTSWNPLFAATNAMKDLSDALFNTRYNVFKYMGRYVQSAFRFTSKKDSEYRKLWDAYRGMGGFQAGFYKGDLGAYDKRSGLRKGIARFTNALNNLNDYIEQIPRFAEFVASVKAGNSYEKALYDAADVTTNFSRGGSLVRKLNRSWIPFLNPAVQGWSKMYRTFFNPMDRLSEQEINKMTKSAKGRKLLSVYGELALKTAVLGIGAGALNDLLFRWIDEDEDYEKLPLNVKENYYLIKSGDKFIKIPKGRVTALLGMGSARIIEYLNGNEEALDAWNWFTTAWGMVSPIDAASRHIASPVFDVLANRTWYGTEIESRTMEQMYEAKDRYDESTSSIAIAIGQALNLSPKKIHYFIDQYSGVLGDIILPMTTNKAEQGMIAARFVVDPLYTNNISNEYYNLKEELTYAKSAKDLSAMMVLKYLNKSDDKLSEIYQLKRDVANYEDLSIEEKKLLISKLKDAGLVDISNKATLTDVEKREITNILQALLNGTLAQLTENVETFEQIALDDGFEDKFSKFIYSDMYIDFDEKKKNTAYNKAMGYYYELYMSKMLGVKLIPKYALYDAIGANETALYLTEISKIESDKDRNGDTITGSRKKKVHKYIQGLELTVQQKNILMYLAGYTPTDAGKGAVNRYLLQNGYTRKEIDEIWN